MEQPVFYYAKKKGLWIRFEADEKSKKARTCRFGGCVQEFRDLTNYGNHRIPSGPVWFVGKLKGVISHNSRIS